MTTLTKEALYYRDLLRIAATDLAVVCKTLDLACPYLPHGLDAPTQDLVKQYAAQAEKYKALVRDETMETKK